LIPASILTQNWSQIKPSRTYLIESLGRVLLQKLELTRAAIFGRTQNTASFVVRVRMSSLAVEHEHQLSHAHIHDRGIHIVDIVKAKFENLTLNVY